MAAARAFAAGPSRSGSGEGPATIRPRSTSRTRAANRASSAGGVGRRTAMRVSGAASGRPSRRQRMRGGEPVRDVARDAVGRERLGEGQVHVYRAGGAAEGGGDRARRQSPQMNERRLLRLGRRGLHEVAHMAAEYPGLVDRLVRVRAPQPVRPVGGQQQEGRLAVRCLHHGRKEVGDRGPRGGDHRNGPPGTLAQSEREERRRPLVQVGEDAQTRVRGRRHDQRSRAVAGRQHHLADAGSRQLVQQDAGPQQVPVRAGHLPSMLSESRGPRPRPARAAPART